MPYRLRMSAELGDWLAELSTFHPASAAEVAAALVSVMTANDPSSLPVVGHPAADPIDPREVVDDLYQTSLDALQRVRNEVAEASWKTVAAKQLLADLDKDTSPDPAVRAWLSQALTNARRHEARLTARSKRLEREVDAFRTSKETAKAMYTAAQATARIRDAIDAATGAESVPESGDQLAAQRRAVASAEANLRAVAEQAARTLREILDLAGPDAGKSDSRHSASAVADVLELRADALGRDVRLLLAVEPADAITLLAALDGEDAIAEHRAQAIELAGDLLADIRAGDWPPADALSAADLAVTFADAATFLGRFFPADGGAIAERAAGLAVAQSLAGLRNGIGMSLADLSVETGITEERLRIIEEGGLRVAQVYEAVAYVRALGGRLTFIAEFGESAPVQLT
jgi:hypothetical protein